LRFKNAALSGSELKGKPSLGVLSQATSVSVALTEHVNCFGIPMFGCFSQPFQCKRIVFLHCNPVVVEDTDVVLGIRVTRLGSNFVMNKGPTAISPHADSVVICGTEPHV